RVFHVTGVQTCALPISAGWRELYISMTIAALETDRAIITPWVTSPFLRRPLVAASSLATLQSLSGGRIAMRLATGGSNVMAAGRSEERRAGKAGEARAS